MSDTTPVGAARFWRSRRSAAVAGIIFGVLLLTAMLMLRLALSEDSLQSLQADARRRELIRLSLHLVPFAGIAFLWFIAVVRNLIGEREDQFFATVFLGSGLLFVAMMFAAAAAEGALLVAVKFQHEPIPSPETVVTVRSLAFAFLYVYAMRMAAVFTIVVSTIGMRLGVFPRWLVIAGYLVAGALIVNVSYSALLVLVFPAWVAAVSVVILESATRPTRESGPPARPGRSR